MGDPRKKRKKYDTPVHPWQKSTIDEEKKLTRAYGFKNKKEQWKMQTRLKKYKLSAKQLIATRTAQAERERQQLLEKLVKFGLLNPGSTLDDVLGLSIQNFLDRRLQSLVFRKGYARSMKQARQFITHRHVLVSGKIRTFPSDLVSVDEEPTISFKATSTLVDESHPERGPGKPPREEPEEAPSKYHKRSKRSFRRVTKKVEKPKAKKEEKPKEEVKEAPAEEKPAEEKKEEPKAKEKVEAPKEEKPTEEKKLSNDNEKLSSKKGLQKSETFEKGLEKSKTSQKEEAPVEAKE